jgi:ribosomal protein L37AE/L43A
VISKIKTGGWFTYFKIYKVEFIVVVGLILLIWFALLVVYKLSKQIAERNHYSGMHVQTPEYGWKYLQNENYKKVIWRPRIPLFWGPDIQPQEITKINFDELEIEVPPRCPKCETELDETKTIWGWFRWKCPECGFTTRKIYNANFHSDQLTKVVKRKTERQIFKS